MGVLFEYQGGSSKGLLLGKKGHFLWGPFFKNLKQSKILFADEYFVRPHTNISIYFNFQFVILTNFDMSRYTIDFGGKMMAPYINNGAIVIFPPKWKNIDI